jgi:hypothetical protein
MPSAVAKGQYWQTRTKKFLEAQGYVVIPLQLMAWIRTKTGFLPVKRDALGADLLAKSVERTLYVQVKGGASWRDQLAAARQEFAKYPLTATDEQWIVGWPPYAHEPEIEVVAIGPCGPQHAVIVPTRKKPRAVLPLFARAR